MSAFGQKLKREFQPSRFADSTAALAGLANSTSAAVGAAAAFAAPTGFSALGVALGLTSAPLIVTVAPAVAVVAAGVTVVAGLARFRAWPTTRKAEDARAGGAAAQ